jgi:hypothetical protein
LAKKKKKAEDYSQWKKAFKVLSVQYIPLGTLLKLKRNNNSKPAIHPKSDYSSPPLPHPRKNLCLLSPSYAPNLLKTIMLFSSLVLP